ncbi:MAG: HAMP domain-containing histidine kinase [Deltaproteobacteria bacterium]|nr:HAMP domain-containing histidine kinase [Deltaproteobacteria bacterium]
MKTLGELATWTHPEYRDRHLFTFHLRVAISAGLASFYFYFLHDVLQQTGLLTTVIVGSFVVAGVAYILVRKNRYVFLAFFLEFIADLTGMTVILYLTGGPYSTYYTIFVLYIISGGVFYNYRLALLVSIFVAVWYGCFLLACLHGVIPPLILDYGDQPAIPAYTPFAHFLFTVVALGIGIYTVKIASFFSQRREHLLEVRNREFAALHQMSSTIRGTLSLREVIDQVLKGVLEGLDFETVSLLRFHEEGGERDVVVHTLRDHPRVREAEAALGVSLDGLRFPLDAFENSVLTDILHRRIVYRRSLPELLEGLEAFIPRERWLKAQATLDIQRVAVVPVVVGERVLGALMGFSRIPYVEERSVSRLEAFANQVALSLESAELIERLRTANERLEKANQVKSDFLATMSHELRTPLTAIIGFSELLLEGVMGELTAEQRESISEVLHNGHELLELINSLLDLAKVEAGKMPLDLRPVNIESLVRRVVRMVDSLMQKKKLDLRLRLAQNLPAITVDERKLQQILLNLLSNAIKFTPEAGTITITAEPPAPPKDGVRFTIEDTGIGIPEGKLEQIFEAFHQVDSSMTRSYGGTGLGLALARQFVELHGGTIWAESAEGKGTRFVFMIP